MIHTTHVRQDYCDLSFSGLQLIGAGSRLSPRAAVSGRSSFPMERYNDRLAAEYVLLPRA